MKKIVLASSSPRRKEILEKIPLDFVVIPSDYEEEDVTNDLFCYSKIEKSSYCKALDVASKVDFDALIIAADTIVILGSVCLLKPLDSNEAFLLLKRLSGKTHNVTTAVTLMTSEREEWENEFFHSQANESKSPKGFMDALTKKSLTRSLTTGVEFRELSDDEIRRYIKEFNPLDKAGAYGIQDFVDEKSVLNPPQSSFIKSIQGDYYNVMGLSPSFLLNMMEDFYKP